DGMTPMEEACVNRLSARCCIVRLRPRSAFGCCSKPREKRLVLSVFSFRRLRGSPLACASHRSTHQAERRRVGVATGSRHHTPGQSLPQSSTLMESVPTRSTAFLGGCHERSTCFRRI